MSTLFGAFPFLLKLYADSGYQGPRHINLEIVRRSDIGKFVVLPKRWIVERTIVWLTRCRRLAKDWECLNRNGLAFPSMGFRSPDGQKALSNPNMISDGRATLP